MNSTGISQFNQARIEWAIRLRYSPMPDLDMDMLGSQLNAFRIGELRTVGKTWELMMERDGELAINSDKRKADSACLEWQIASDGSPDGDKHAAALQYFYNNLSASKALDQDSTGGVDELIYQVLSAVDYYYSAHEILLRIDNAAAKEITAEFRHTPVWFFEARRGYLGYLKHIFDLYGQPCIAGEWLTAVNIGWMRPLCMAYAAKWFSLTDWQIFCRRYGSGFLEAITNATQDSKEWNDAVTALRTLASDGVVLHNQGVEFKFLEQAARNQLPFQPIVELIDRLYAKCYRGVDLATGSRGMGGEGFGERAGGRNPVGASVQKEESGILLIRDSKWITGVFNDRIDRPVIRYLFNEEPRAWFALLPPPDDTTSEDLQSLQTLVPMGLRVALKEVYKRFRWSIPDAGDACLTPPAVPAATSIDARGDTQRSMLSPSPLPSGGEGPGGESPKSDDSTLVSGSDNAEEQKTHQAQTDENTPIAAGADPARNPGLLAPGERTSLSLNDALVDGPSRQMPDTQVDSSAFWSRAALMPKGPDGQTLPMPSLGYAVPNDNSGTGVPAREFLRETRAINELIERHANLAARGLANCRAAQALKREINRRQLEIQTSKNETNGIALSNWEFDPKQPRDRYGKWTTGDNVVSLAATTTSQSPNSLGLHATARPSSVSSIAGSRPPELPVSAPAKGLWAQIKSDTAKDLNALGEFGKAVVGDVAAGVGGYSEFSGNITSFFKGEELPIDKALRDAALEEQFRGEVPVATVIGRISEGIASTLPMLPLIEAMPPSVQLAATLKFTTQMVKDTPEIARQLGEELSKPPNQRDADKIDSLVAQAIQIIGFTAEGVVGLNGSVTSAQEKTAIEWPEIQGSAESELGVPSDHPTSVSSAEGAAQKIQPESPGSGPIDPSRSADQAMPSPKAEPTSPKEDATPTPQSTPQPAPPAKGGRLGNATTRQQIADIAKNLVAAGWKIVAGGGGKEEYIPGAGGARKGSSYPDITATKNGKTLRINTIDTRADGVTPSTREARNAARIRSQKPNDTLILIPKT